MPRFYFNVHEGNVIFWDNEGSEFVDFAAARGEAVKSARELAGERMKQGEPLADCAIEVIDSTGRWFFTVPFVSLI